MSRSLMLIILGALVALTPISGLPMSILSFVLPVLGLLVVAVGISFRRERAKASRPDLSSHEASLSASS